MITQDQFDNLQVGDKLANGVGIGVIQAIHHKVILVLWDDDGVYHYPFGVTKGFKLLKPIKMNQGFEVREYPERPVVLVNSAGTAQPMYLRFLVEVRESDIITVVEAAPRHSNNFNDIRSCWKYIKTID